MNIIDRILRRGATSLSGNAFSSVSRAFDRQEEAKGKLLALDAASDKIEAGNESIRKDVIARQTRLAYSHSELDRLLSLL